MRFLIGLFSGLIAGWVARGTADRFARQQVREAVEEDRLKLAQAQAVQLRNQLATNQEKLTAAEAEINRLRAELAQSSPQVDRPQDPLEKIRGIGPVFAHRFREAGIYTFTELANLTPDQIEEIIAPKSWQKIEPEEWIAQAKQLGRQ